MYPVNLLMRILLIHQIIQRNSQTLIFKTLNLIMLENAVTFILCIRYMFSKPYIQEKFNFNLYDNHHHPFHLVNPRPILISFRIFSFQSFIEFLRVPQAEGAKYFGLHLDCRLNWRKHVHQAKTWISTEKNGYSPVKHYHWLKTSCYYILILPTWACSVQLSPSIQI